MTVETCMLCHWPLTTHKCNIVHMGKCLRFRLDDKQPTMTFGLRGCIGVIVASDTSGILAHISPDIDIGVVSSFIEDDTKTIVIKAPSDTFNWKSFDPETKDFVASLLKQHPSIHFDLRVYSTLMCTNDKNYMRQLAIKAIDGEFTFPKY